MSQRRAHLLSAWDLKCPGDDTLAAYLEQLLRSGAKREVETHLTRCEKCRAIVVDAQAIANELGKTGRLSPDEPSIRAAAAVVPPSRGWLPFVGARWPMGVLGSMAAAASVVFAVVVERGAVVADVPIAAEPIIRAQVSPPARAGMALAPVDDARQPEATQSLRAVELPPVSERPLALITVPSRAPANSKALLPGLAAGPLTSLGIESARDFAMITPQWQRLMFAVEHLPTRLVAGRLATAAYRPAPDAAMSLSAEMRTDIQRAADMLEKYADENAGSHARAMSGAAWLLAGDGSRAIEQLDHAVRLDPTNATALNDLAVSYLTRAAASGSIDDLQSALTVSDRAIALVPMLKAPYFNRALALEGLHDSSAEDAWRTVMVRDVGTAWAEEAAIHVDALASSR